MAQTEMSGEDASLDEAVAKIMAKGPDALGEGPRREGRRGEDRLDREPHEMDDGVEVDDDRAGDDADDGAKNGAGVEGEDAQFLEIPGGEGEEPEKIPLTEAVEAVKQFRQMNGDIATAIITAESEAQQKQDQILDGMLHAYKEVETKARAAVQMMHALLPQPPDRALLDTDPQEFYRQRTFYEDYVEYARRVEATIGQASDGQKTVIDESQKAMAEREEARLARYIPEWSDPKTREAKRTEILDTLGKKYGITKDELEGVVSHKAWRMMADLAKISQAQTKAPEIKKAVQERAAKVINGRLPARENNGRFINEDRKALKETGSEEAFARKLLRSGALKNL